jgi:hypothetical protein
MSPSLAIELTETGAEPERLEELTIDLRRELLALDVDDVARVSAGDAPPGSRSIDLAAIGALLVTMNQTTDVLAHIVSTVRDWLRRSPEPKRSVQMTIGGRSIELSAASDEQQDRLVAEFIKAGADGG